MTDKCFDLIALLSDGKFHSGQKIGAAMGISRASVWKQIRCLNDLGLEVFAVSGRGYRLAKPLELLNEARIRGHLQAGKANLLPKLELHQQLLSTNSYLMQQAVEGAASGTACLAEQQLAGRGRRGREWISPFGSNIYLSLLWRFNDGASRLGGLSLAVAVAVMRALSAAGLNGGGVKWPNDILVDNHKLAGILVEVAGESNGPCFAVMGIGVNVDMPSRHDAKIDQAWTDLRSAGVNTGRNELAALLLNELLSSLPLYQEEGLDAFRAAWQHWDLTEGKTVRITHGDEAHYGVARGIDERGLLLLQDESGLHRYASGEVSLRTMAG